MSASAKYPINLGLRNGVFEMWIANAKPEHKYMSVNCFSGHMSISPCYHTTLTSVLKGLHDQKGDNADFIPVVWDLIKSCILYEDNGSGSQGALSSIQSMGEENSFTPTIEDMFQYWSEIAEKEAIEEARNRAYHNERLAQMEADHNLNKVREQHDVEYAKYVKNCLKLGNVPMPYFEYFDGNTSEEEIEKNLEEKI